MVVPRIWFEIRVNYQPDANICYFSSTCFGPIRPSSGAIEFIISFTNAAYGVLGAVTCLEERALVVCCSATHHQGHHMLHL